VQCGLRERCQDFLYAWRGIAEKMPRSPRRRGVCSPSADLQAHRSTWVKLSTTPIATTTLWELPTNGRDCSVNRAQHPEGLISRSSTTRSAQTVPLANEAPLKMAFVEAPRYIAAPERVSSHQRTTLEGVCRARRALIWRNRHCSLSQARRKTH